MIKRSWPLLTRTSHRSLNISACLLILAGCGPVRETATPQSASDQVATSTVTPDTAPDPQGRTLQKSGLTLESFRAKLEERTGIESRDCGHMDAGSESTAVNCCVVEQIGLNHPFYATFAANIAGDSFIAHGISSNGDDSLSIYVFDSDPRGGAQWDNGEFREGACNDMQVLESTCSANEPGLPIRCSDADWSWFQADEELQGGP